MAVPIVPLAIGGAAAGFVAGRVFGQPPAAPPVALAGGSGAPANPTLSGTTSDLWGSWGSASLNFADQFGPPGVLPGVAGPYDSGGLPGGTGGDGGSTAPPYSPPYTGTPTSTPTTQPPPSTAAPHYYAQVTVPTALWNDGTQRWVYNGPNAIPVGTRLVVRGAKYLKGGVSCYPIVAGTPYGGYWVPVAHVKLLGLAP